MLVLGLILILLAALALLVVIVAGSNDTSHLAVGSSFHWDPSTMAMFLAGAATLLVLIVGMDMTRTGLRKARQRRRDAKELGRLSAKLEQHEAATRREQAEGAGDTREAPTRETGDTGPTRETREPGDTGDTHETREL